MKTKLLRKIRSKLDIKYNYFSQGFRGYDKELNTPFWQFGNKNLRVFIFSALIRVYSYKKVQKLTKKWGKNY